MVAGLDPLVAHAPAGALARLDGLAGGLWYWVDIVMLAEPLSNCFQSRVLLSLPAFMPKVWLLTLPASAWMVLVTFQVTSSLKDPQLEPKPNANDCDCSSALKLAGLFQVVDSPIPAVVHSCTGSAVQESDHTSSMDTSAELIDVLVVSAVETGSRK